MFEVVGFKSISYNRKSDGKHIEGMEVYLTSDPEDDRVIGKEAMAVYLNKERSCYSPKIGDVVRLCYNRYGRVDDLLPL